MSAEPALVFAALGDRARLDLLATLRDQPRSLTALAQGRGMTRQGVAKHLRVLEAAGLAEARRAGREVLWQGRPQGLEPARDWLEQAAARWDGALERLKRHVEGG